MFCLFCFVLLALLSVLVRGSPEQNYGSTRTGMSQTNKPFSGDMYSRPYKREKYELSSPETGKRLALNSENMD